MTIMTYEVVAAKIAERLAESERRHRFGRTRRGSRMGRWRPAQRGA